MLAWLPYVMDVTNAAPLASPWKRQRIRSCLSEPEHDGASVVQKQSPRDRQYGAGKGSGICLTALLRCNGHGKLHFQHMNGYNQDSEHTHHTFSCVHVFPFCPT